MYIVLPKGSMYVYGRGPRKISGLCDYGSGEFGWGGLDIDESRSRIRVYGLAGDESLGCNLQGGCIYG